MTTRFVHLHLHSEYSLTDGIVRIERPDAKSDDPKKRHLEERFKTLAERAAELGFPAIALTDAANMFAAVKFYKTAEGQGVKPILATDLLVGERIAGETPEWLTVLVQNDTGYRNLLKLLSRSYTEGQGRGQPTVAREWLAGHTEGLIALSGAKGEIGRALLADRLDQAQAAAADWRTLFGDRFYLEIARCGRAEDESHLRVAVAFGRLEELPVVATNDVRFLRREDFDAHEARVCIAQGRLIGDERRARDCSPEQYLKSADEMAQLFADLPEALENSVEIARRCTMTLALGKYHLPDFPVPAGMTMPEFLRQQAKEGLRQRLLTLPQQRPEAEYWQRLEYEAGVIEKMGFAGYFLVVADFIRWSKSHGVPVGPGRGSGAGSLVAYAIGITDLDPLPYDLLFERFLNPERVSMPDFDVDFCMDGRDRVIDYVADKYGRDHVGQIITYGTMAARAVVRDVARVLGHPYGFGDRVAKMIPGGPQGLTLGEALDMVPELQQAYRDEEDIKAVIDLGMQLEGITRGVGKHAGGVVIAPKALTAFVPLFCEPGGGGLVTQFDMKDLESVGLVKFDFLGLKTLTIIQAAVDLLNAKRKPSETPLEILKIPLDDKPTYKLYESGLTTAVFQMESGGMQRASVDLKPDTFEDIIALISLYRPGPMELIPEFVARKHGRARTEYLHPAMEDSLKPTLGIFVYQEQVMQIAQRLAGYTLGGADLLRRAMGKKIASEMQKQRAIFTDGAKKNGIPEQTASDIFDLMEKFANYGFNKSHAAAYALVSYQTAWLKTHHPAEFMAAVLSCEMSHTDTVVMMIDECRRMGLKILAPDINRSDFRFKVVGPKEILYGLGAIKGAGEGALTGVLEERQKNGPFTDLFDFCRRIDSRKTNKRVLEALIYSGALDALGPNRPSLLKNLGVALQFAEQSADAANQVDLFGVKTPAAVQPMQQTPDTDWPELERLKHEKDTLGLYLSGHPIESYRALIEQVCTGSIKKVIEMAPAPAQGTDGERFARRGPSVVVAGWVVEVRKFSQGTRAVLRLDDRTGQISVPLGMEQIGALGALLKSDTLLFVGGRVSADTFTGGWQIHPRDLFDLDKARARYADRIVLRWPGERAFDAEALAGALKPVRAAQGCPITVRYLNDKAQATLDLGAEWRVRALGEGLAALRRLVGENNVRVLYRRAAVESQADAYES
ncbi:MAG: DNA polymerase III subunit alpha [Gammaproteobacteria bacterium]|nr:DNA polymerase III subunit alpha [Gammaproteobacteria bacterium]